MDSPEKKVESEIILNDVYIWTRGKFARLFYKTVETVDIASYKCNLPDVITYWKLMFIQNKKLSKRKLFKRNNRHNK